MSSACSAPAAKRWTSSRTNSTTAFASVIGADASNCFRRAPEYSVLFLSCASVTPSV